MDWLCSEGVLYFCKYIFLFLIYVMVALFLKALLSAFRSLNTRGADRPVPAVAPAHNGAVDFGDFSDHIMTRDEMPAVMASFRNAPAASAPKTALPKETLNFARPQGAGQPAGRPQNRSRSAEKSASRGAGWGCLEVLEGRQAFPEGFNGIIPLEGEVVLGRNNDCTYPLNDPFVSGHHLRVTLGDNGPILEDMQSRNGTVYDDSPLVRPLLLHDGAVFSLGDIVIRYCRDMVPASEYSARGGRRS